uniref:Venom protein n=1 Tax=Hadrurus spadix TaxID=141984 RepID=A0A1W7R967_9SCOR
MFFILLAIVLLLIPSQGSLSRDGCESGEDCPQRECCLRRHFTKSCEMLTEEGEFCSPRNENGTERAVYMLFCPCESGLQCIPKTVEDRNGTTIYPNLKCTRQYSED